MKKMTTAQWKKKHKGHKISKSDGVDGETGNTLKLLTCETCFLIFLEKVVLRANDQMGVRKPRNLGLGLAENP